jgi:predicted YcjX-like family ATPase
VGPDHEGRLPIEAGKLANLFKVFNVPAPEFKRSVYAYEQFLDELIVPNPSWKWCT